MECAPQDRASRFPWSCYLAQSYGDEAAAQADMWVPVNLAKASRLHMSPNVTSTLMSLGRAGRARAAGCHRCWLLGWFTASQGEGRKEEGEPVSKQATAGLAWPGWGSLRSSIRSFIQAVDRAGASSGLQISPVSRESLQWCPQSPGQEALRE